MVNFYEKKCYAFITWNNKTLIEASFTNNMHTGGTISSTAAAFGGLWVVSFHLVYDEDF